MCSSCLGSTMPIPGPPYESSCSESAAVPTTTTISIDSGKANCADRRITAQQNMVNVFVSTFFRKGVDTPQSCFLVTVTPNHAFVRIGIKIQQIRSLAAKQELMLWIATGSFSNTFVCLFRFIRRDASAPVRKKLGRFSII